MDPKCNHKCPYEREAEEDLSAVEEKGCGHRSKDGSDGARSQEHQQPLKGEDARMGFAPGASRRNKRSRHLDFSPFRLILDF